MLRQRKSLSKSTSKKNPSAHPKLRLKSDSRANKITAVPYNYHSLSKNTALPPSSTLSIQEKLSSREEEDIQIIPKDHFPDCLYFQPGIPIRHRFLSYYRRPKYLNSGTYHLVRQVMKKYSALENTSEEDRDNPPADVVHGFLKLRRSPDPLKKNEPGAADPVMTTLEVIGCATSRIVARDNIPPSRVVRNVDGSYIGPVSKALPPGFKPLHDDPITAEDLNVEADYSIKELNYFDKLIDKKGYQLDELVQTARGSQLKFHDRYIFNETIEYFDGETNFSKNMSVSARDVRRYRMIKSLAILSLLMLVTEYEDGHAFNLLVNRALGIIVLIDFDMVWWRKLSEYKDLGLAAEYLSDRMPKEGQYAITEENIIHLPNLSPEAMASFWFTKSENQLVRWAGYFARAFGFTWTDNAFKEEHCAVFRLLEHNKIYNYHKYVTLLKCTLIERKYFQGEVLLNMSEHFSNTNGSTQSSLSEIFIDHAFARILNVREVAGKMQTFHQFLNDNGYSALEDCMEYFEKLNNKMQNKFNNPERLKQKIEIKYKKITEEIYRREKEKARYEKEILKEFNEFTEETTDIIDDFVEIEDEAKPNIKSNPEIEEKLYELAAAKNNYYRKHFELFKFDINKINAAGTMLINNAKRMIALGSAEDVLPMVSRVEIHNEVGQRTLTDFTQENYKEDESSSLRHRKCGS